MKKRNKSELKIKRVYAFNVENKCVDTLIEESFYYFLQRELAKKLG